MTIIYSLTLITVTQESSHHNHDPNENSAIEVIGSNGFHGPLLQECSLSRGFIQSKKEDDAKLTLPNMYLSSKQITS